MKKIILALIIAFVIMPIYSDIFKVSVKGEAFIKVDGEPVSLNKEDSVTEEDTIVVMDDNTTVYLKIGSVTIRLVGTGTYKVKDYIK